MMPLQTTGRFHDTYRRINVTTANPGRILITLYDAAIKHTRSAREQIAGGDVAGKGISLGKAQAIVAEFINALDVESAPELCANLERIYRFMIERITEANSKMDASALDPVIENLSSLRDAWAEAVRGMAKGDR